MFKLLQTSGYSWIIQELTYALPFVLVVLQAVYNGHQVVSYAIHGTAMVKLDS